MRNEASVSSNARRYFSTFPDRPSTHGKRRVFRPRELARDLGFLEAYTIGGGTMIGAGIFLLAGVALELTGPAVIFSYVAAGIVCMITAASAAELATGMPTSGGDFVIIGASREWTLRQGLFGSIPDVVADRADCSGLMARRYVPDTLSVRAVEGVKRLKESVGLTTLSEE